MFKRTVLKLLMLVVVGGGMFGYWVYQQQEGGESRTGNDCRPAVAVTVFPLYDFARTIAGNKLKVFQVIPPGADVHAFSLSPGDRMKIEKASLFLYCGNGLEPWAESLSRTFPSGKGFDCTHGIGLDGEAGECSDCGEEHASSRQGFDPHIWTDPVLAAQIAVRVGTALAAADTSNQPYYALRTEQLKQMILSVDTAFRVMLDSAKRRDIVYCGHAAFAHAAERYRLNFIRAYSGTTSNEQLSPSRLQKMISAADSVPVIYAEENVLPRLAEQIQNATGKKILTLHGIHNLSAEEIKHGEHWISIMSRNVENLRKGLCE